MATSSRGPSGCHRFSSFRCFPKTFHTNLLVSEEVWHANTGQKPHSPAQASVQQLLSFIQQTPLLLIPISSEAWCQNLNVTLGRTYTLVDNLKWETTFTWSLKTYFSAISDCLPFISVILVRNISEGDMGKKKTHVKKSDSDKVW